MNNRLAKLGVSGLKMWINDVDSEADYLKRKKEGVAMVLDKYTVSSASLFSFGCDIRRASIIARTA